MKELILAKRVEPITLGIDVSKDTLAMFNWQIQQRCSIANEPDAIHTFLNSLTGPVCIAVEPTITCR